ncbi:PREDICTED: uncharacterized protein LOC105995589 [Dipodomys ordii]|uniref:Uncharacterized protein LOC105995589 n=1 Tax=Dipodomys ordii TaxID=10020 RepID=A0A1S3G7L9_DIPOR|nr:PREDICTED: uncharacterized protein LOC105995589 [Dipodomys ordii]
MKTLLLTAVLLGLVAALQAQEPLSVFSEAQNLAGTWYIKAIVTQTKLEEEKRTAPVFPITMVALEGGDLEIKLTIMFEGRCHDLTFQMQKTDEPGKYIDGKTPEPNAEALEEFQRFAQRKGFQEENIFVPKQKGPCFRSRGVVGLEPLAGPLLTLAVPLFLQKPVSQNSNWGKWYIIRWAGTIPSPREKLLAPLPPFSFVVNSMGKLEFQMRILKPSGCQLFKLPLSVARVPASFVGWWKHMIYIWLVTPRSYGIAYFGDRMNNRRVQMMMLFGRTLEEHPGALMIFEVFVEKKGLNKADLICPPHLARGQPCLLHIEPPRPKGPMSTVRTPKQCGLLPDLRGQLLVLPWGAAVIQESGETQPSLEGHSQHAQTGSSELVAGPAQAWI